MKENDGLLICFCYYVFSDNWKLSFPGIVRNERFSEKSKLEKSAAEISYVISGPFNEHKTN